jgi:hypothetical protein
MCFHPRTYTTLLVLIHALVVKVGGSAPIGIIVSRLHTSFTLCMQVLPVLLISMGARDLILARKGRERDDYGESLEQRSEHIQSH